MGAAFSALRTVLGLVAKRETSHKRGNRCGIVSRYGGIAADLVLNDIRVSDCSPASASAVTNLKALGSAISLARDLGDPLAAQAGANLRVHAGAGVARNEAALRSPTTMRAIL